jgi:hypothetical protein
MTNLFLKNNKILARLFQIKMRERVKVLERSRFENKSKVKAPGGRFELPFPCENALYG